MWCALQRLHERHRLHHVRDRRHPHQWRGVPAQWMVMTVSLSARVQGVGMLYAYIETRMPSLCMWLLNDVFQVSG